MSHDLTSPVKYELLPPPFSLEFREMPKDELKDYYKWFISIIPHRIEVLRGAVQGTTGFEDWKADYSPDSLLRLGPWFMRHVETRQRSEKEVEDIYDDSPKWFRAVQVPDWDLTIRTFSLSFDIGMYLAEVFLHNNEQLRWHHDMSGSKRNIDFGQPVLSGFGRTFFNPVRITITSAYGLAYGLDDTSEKRLREIYDVWISYIEKQQV